MVDYWVYYCKIHLFSWGVPGETNRDVQEAKLDSEIKLGRTQKNVRR